MDLKVLVVDDTIVYRKIVGDTLSDIPEVKVVGTASNGKIALSQITVLKPDLLILDMEMPEMTGLEVLRAIKEKSLDVGVIVLSALTVKGGDLTMKALELGAFDFITKPDGLSPEESRKQIKNQLTGLIKAYGHSHEIRSILKGISRGSTEKRLAPAKKEPFTAEITSQSQTRREFLPGRFRAEAVGIGISTGGPKALMNLMPKLPGDLNIPIFIVQHMPPAFTRSLADNLDSRCSLKVKEGEDGETVRTNTAYIAPGGKQMKVTLGADALTKIIRVTDDPPENHCRPAVDYLFRSLAHHYLGRATGVIMTGMGNDGTVGLRLMKRNGAMVIAQDADSCVVSSMPREAIKAGVVDQVLPLDEMAMAIIRTVR
jgi:two-component system, chemotaxis family, protein-glutamate methylesterase/glutaminase